MPDGVEPQDQGGDHVERIQLTFDAPANNLTGNESGLSFAIKQLETIDVLLAKIDKKYADLMTQLRKVPAVVRNAGSEPSVTVQPKVETAAAPSPAPAPAP